MGNVVLPGSGRENTNGLIVWWPFFGGSGQDESGSGQTGTLTLAPTVTHAPILVKGKPAVGLTFNGTNQYVVCSRLVNISLVTISAWVIVNGNPGVQGNIAGFMDGIGSSTADKDLMVTTSGFARWMVYDGSTATVTGTTVITDNRPHLVTAVVDGTNSILYVDGVLDGSAAASGSYTGYSVPNIFLNGAQFGGVAAGYLACSAFDFRVYNRALSPGEVNALFNRGIACPDEAEMPALFTGGSFLAAWARSSNLPIIGTGNY